MFIYAADHHPEDSSLPAYTFTIASLIIHVATLAIHGAARDLSEDAFGQ